MKKFFILIISSLLYQLSMAQTSGTITDINNNVTKIDSLAGKKVLIVILPLQQDTGMISQLMRFQTKHGDSVTVIGLVCLTNCNVTQQSIQTIYQGVAEAGIIVSAGITAANPQNERESVLKWLSERSLNRKDETWLTGSKFFLSKNGKMYAQVGAATSLDMSIVNNIVKTKVPKEN